MKSRDLIWLMSCDCDQESTSLLSGQTHKCPITPNRCQRVQMLFGTHIICTLWHLLGVIGHLCIIILPPVLWRILRVIGRLCNISLYTDWPHVGSVPHLRSLLLIPDSIAHSNSCGKCYSSELCGQKNETV